MKNIYQFIRENKTYSILGAILMAQGIFYTFTDNDLMATLTLLFFACVVILYNVEKIRENVSFTVAEVILLHEKVSSLDRAFSKHENEALESLKLFNAKDFTQKIIVDYNLMKTVLNSEIKEVENAIRKKLIEENVIAKKKSKK